MVLLAIFLFISSILLGIVVVNLFPSLLPRIAKISTAFFLGIYLSTIAIFLFSLVIPMQDSLFSSLIIVCAIQGALLYFIFKKKKSLFAVNVSRLEFFLLSVFFLFGWYVMQKSFGYSHESFLIASNIYQDFGWVHIPIIRSFSEGNNIPPTFPFAAGIPLLYHFFFDFAAALYEKLGVRIDIAYNLLSAVSFAGVLALIYSFSQMLFGKKPLVGIFAVLLFLFNSSLSFIDAIKLYWGPDLLSKFYHHNVYLGNGPFGESIVSIFWNLNTYLNQRHFVFGLGIFLIFVHVFYDLFTNNKTKFPWIFLGIIVGMLPFWHSSIFLAIVVVGFVTGCILYFSKGEWKQVLFFLLTACLLALPQFLFISHFQTMHISFWNPGFLLSHSLTFTSFGNYWFYNLGLSLLLIPLGVLFAKGKQKIFFIAIFLLFVLPNLFQFSTQMYDNHKFFNMFILLANIYTAYLLYLLLKKRNILKLLACVLLFFLTFSGLFDFLVMKNDVQTSIIDYPQDPFLSWTQNNTDRDAIFLTNKEIYDPITFIGRQSFLGRPHYLFAFGISPDERVQVKTIMLSGKDIIQSTKLFRQYKIKYIVLYEQNHPLANKLKILYRDKTHLVLQAP